MTAQYFYTILEGEKVYVSEKMDVGWFLVTGKYFENGSTKCPTQTTVHYISIVK